MWAPIEPGVGTCHAKHSPAHLMAHAGETAKPGSTSLPPTTPTSIESSDARLRPPPDQSLRADVYVDRNDHANTIEGFWSQVKCGINVAHSSTTAQRETSRGVFFTLIHMAAVTTTS